MNYEEKLREIINSNNEYYPSEDKAVFAKYFPELKESEDKQMWIEIRNFIWGYPDKLPERDKWLAWLEKKKQKFEESEVSVTEFQPKPKFKVGNFITNNDITEHGKPEIFEVKKVCSSWYDVENIYDGRQTMITFSQDYTCHLWTIDDVKQCDVNKMSNYEKIKNATMTFLNGSSYDECIEWLKKQKD